MKKILYTVLFLFSALVFGQDKGITYQAVIYVPGGQNIPGVDIVNSPMVNRPICLKFSFVDSSSNLEYEEVVKTTTDEFGMVNLVIGIHTQTGGYASSFGAIVWDLTGKRLKVALDPYGVCSEFEEISNGPLSSVPFAYAAVTANTISGVVDLINGGTGATTAVEARANLGLGNVNNTSDASKPISTATQTALNAKENTANKSLDIIQDGASDIKFPSVKAVKTYVDNQLGSGSATVVDADATTKGTIQLAGDLSGTAALPTVPGLALKENTTNKSFDVTVDGTSDLKFPSVKAVKTYVDTAITGATIVDADASTKGKIQLTGDLSGTADLPRITANAITTSKIADTAITDAKIATVSATKITGFVDIANGGTGATTPQDARSNLGLGTASTNNTSDFEVPLAVSAPLVRTVNALSIPTATATVNGYLSAADFNTFATKIDRTEKAANNGVATLGNDGKIPSDQIPAISFQSANVVTSQAAMIAIAGAQVGSIAIRTDINKNFVLSALPATTLSNWLELSTPTAVTSVNGNAGPNVVLTKSDLVLGNVDNTSDINKPISNDTRDALALKANLASPTFTGTVSGITKAMVGLALVDNTPDASKPVSAATQTALNLKANAADVTTALALKENAANKSNTTTLGTSDVLFPTQNAVKTYADAKVVDGITDAVTTSAPTQNAVFDALALKANTADVTTSLALKANTTDVTTSLALKENIANKSTAIDLGSTNPSDVLYPSQKAVKAYVDLQSANAGVADSSITSAKILDGTLVTADFANGSITPDKISGILPVVNGGTGASTVLGAKTNLGLENVNNTSDAAKPVSAATQTALDLKSNVADVTTSLALKEDAANKSTATTLGTSDVLFPTQNAVKTYVDTNITTVNATTTALQGIVTANATAVTTAIAAVQADVDANETAANSALALKANLASPTFTGTVSGIDKTMVGLGSVENTALSTWAGSTNVTTVGTITSGTWNGSVIGSNKGGAGTINGLLKADGTGVVSAAVAGTDYQAPLVAGTNYLVPNAAITGAAKTKITYDAKGLVTAGADATTADIAPSTDKNYVTDAQATVLSNTSGANTGDETASTIKSKLGITTLSGSNTGDQTITLTGDVTGTGTGSFVTAIANDAVTTAKIVNEAITYAKIQNVAADKVLGRTTSGSGVVEEIATTGTGNVVRAISPTLVNPTLENPILSTPAIGAATASTVSFAGATSGSATIAAPDTAGANNIILPAFSGTLATLDGVETLTNKTLTAPELGAATATSINKVAITQPANNATLTIANGKTLTVSDDASVSGSNTGDQTTITGNAGTATKLAAPVAINGVAFDGSADITVTADAGTLTGTALNSTVTTSSLTSVGTLANLTVTNPIVGSITGNAATVTTNADLTGDVTSTGNATTVEKINGTSLAGLATGILKNTTGSGVPSIAVAADFPTLNQNTTGNAATATNLAGGAAGSIPYQTAAATTAMLAKGTDGQVLTLTSGVPSWASSSSGVTTLVYDGTTTYSGGGAIGGSTLTIGTAKVNAPGFVSALAQTFGGFKTFSPTITAASGSAVGTAFTPSLSAAANNDALIGVDISPTYTNGVFTSIANYGLRVQGIHIGRGGANIANNTAVGVDALKKNSSTGGSNTAFGWSSLASNTDGGSNTAVGKSALGSNSTGNYNTAIGGSALVQNTASNNTAVGSGALTANTSGNDNTAIGSDVGNKITTGAKNILIGALAGTYYSSGTSTNTNTTGLNSVLIGYDVRPLANADDNEIIISGYNGTAGTIGLGSHSTLIGNSLTKKSQIYGALTVVPNAATSGNGNSSTIAAQDGFTNGNGGALNLTAGNGNGSGNGGDIILNPGAKGTTGAAGKVYVNGGDMVVNGNTIGAGKYANVGNIVFGTGALETNTLGTNNIAIGQNALKNFNRNSNTYNIAIGTSALSGTSNTSQSNIAIGPNTMDKANLSGQQNIAVGQNAMSGLKDGNFNNAFGVTAMQSSGTSITGSENNAFGYASLISITDGGSNSAFGSRALYSNTTGSENVAVGAFALHSNLVARNNTAIGSSALKGLNSTSNMTNEGSLNIALGYQAGRYFGAAGTSENTLGKGSLFLGYDTRPLNTNDTNEVVISGFSGTVGNPGTVGNGSNTTTIGNSATTDTYIYGKLNLTNQIKITGGTPGLGKVLTSDAVGLASWTTPSSGGVSALAYAATPTNANGGSISGSTLTLAPADATNPGLVSTGAQTFAGVKTFNSDIKVNGITIGKGSVASSTSTIIGKDAYQYATSGTNNVIIGSNAASLAGAALLYNATDGVFIGADSGPSEPTGSTNEIVIGKGAFGAGNNTVTIGNANIAKTLLKGVVELTNSTESLVKGDGALIVRGGAGIIKNLNVGGNTVLEGTLAIKSGSPGINKVLTSDQQGNASWVTPAEADATNPGLVSTGAQTIAGSKTFSGAVSTFNGQVKIADGTQAVNRVLVSDANGLASWANPLPSGQFGTLTQDADAQTLTPDGNGTTSRTYLNSYITLPPGKWDVNCNILTDVSDGNATSGSWWVRLGFSTSSSSLVNNSTDFPINTLISGRVTAIATAKYDMVKGHIIINNTSGSSKTYYLWADNCDLIGANSGSTNSLKKLSKREFGENLIFALPMY